MSKRMNNFSEEVKRWLGNWDPLWFLIGSQKRVIPFAPLETQPLLILTPQAVVVPNSKNPGYSQVYRSASTGGKLLSTRHLAFARCTMFLTHRSKYMHQGTFWASECGIQLQRSGESTILRLLGKLSSVEITLAMTRFTLLSSSMRKLYRVRRQYTL
uniref:ARAD1D27852p n=1 Tax=Blastobotrys adeninivorans TaxID=409370 RepID=A0A060TG41_BLAAD